MSDSDANKRVDSAKKIHETYELSSGIYLLGSFENGVTVYKQQVRAHNLVWSLWELQESGDLPPLQNVAIIGGGISGLTIASGILGRFPDAKVSLFEHSGIFAQSNRDVTTAGFIPEFTIGLNHIHHQQIFRYCLGKKGEHPM